MGKTQIASNVAFPKFRRVMVFIDGENLVCRYQDTKSEGRDSHDNVCHKSNVYVWSPESIKIEGFYEIERATLYTYISGDNKSVDSISNEIKALKFRPHLGSHLPEHLFPKVFWKPRGTKGKGVDIQLTVDVLTHAYRDNYDILYLISGDGDFKPLIEEAMRAGKQVYVAALSSGLNPTLKLAADVFVNLDPYYFK